MRAFKFIVMAACLAVLGQSCQTTPRESDPEKPPRIGTPIPYAPAAVTAGIQFESGAYPTLFDPASSCTLVPASAESPVLTFQTTLRSVFEDSSIAYDVVGLRGVRVSLILPDGSAVNPMQTVLDPALIETPQGALRSYTRSVNILFPNVPMTMATPQPGQPAPGMRLLLEGYGARFFFEWPAVLPAAVRPEPFLQSEAYENLKDGYRKSRAWATEKIHTFD